MIQVTDNERRLANDAHKRYWSSDSSVNDIAESLSISKGRLYELIHPFPTDFPCPECGAQLAWPNRTGRDRGLLICESCGMETDEESLDAGADLPRRGSIRRLTGEDAVGSPAFLAGVALTTVAAGLAVTYLLRRR